MEKSKEAKAVEKKYNVRFYAYAESTECESPNVKKGKTSYLTTLEEAFLDFEFDSLDEAMSFIKMSEKHLVKKPILSGSFCDSYAEDDEWDGIWEISLQVKINN